MFNPPDSTEQAIATFSVPMTLCLKLMLFPRREVTRCVYDVIASSHRVLQQFKVAQIALDDLNVWVASQPGMVVGMASQYTGRFASTT
jgi:hypothetical protein